MAINASVFPYYIYPPVFENVLVRHVRSQHRRSALREVLLQTVRITVYGRSYGRIHLIAFVRDIISRINRRHFGYGVNGVLLFENGTNHYTIVVVGTPFGNTVNIAASLVGMVFKPSGNVCIVIVHLVIGVDIP